MKNLRHKIGVTLMGSLAATICVLGLMGAATTNPGKYGAMISTDGTGNPGTWVALTGTGTPYTGTAPQPAGLMVSTDGTGNPGTWVAATAATFGGSSLPINNPTFTGTLSGPFASITQLVAPGVSPTGSVYLAGIDGSNNVYLGNAPGVGTGGVTYIRGGTTQVALDPSTTSFVLNNAVIYSNANFNGNVSVAGGANTVLRCTTAGTLPIGALTITAGNCGASTDTGLRVK